MMSFLLLVIVAIAAPTVVGTTVWSGTYQVTSQCNTGSCCCISGTFTATQSGTQVSATVPLTGACGGATSAALVLTLASPTSTSASATIGGQTFNVVKNGASVTLSNVNFPTCSGAATCTSGDCLGSSGSSSAPCFHESTLIAYPSGGQKAYSLADFKNGLVPQCRVPHVVRSSNGVRITASCPSGVEVILKLTGDHLVYTANGLHPASTIKAGDLLFQDMNETPSSSCRVIQVTAETNEQLYFGLNCLESNVLANGIKASTFGRYHTIPALWMKYASHVLGVERASRWGDSFVQLLSKMKLF